MKLKTPRFFETTFASYTATEKIGEGGCGTVFAAYDADGNSFAIKNLDENKVTEERRKRF
ncbi:MAG: serine/threonine protein kinase, partial [Alphaproteobacteria bacterium]|nr:serine/threonine protein kinase [Alphaproteobacteria bacterium]